MQHMITTTVTTEGIASDDSLAAIYDRIARNPQIEGPSVSARPGEISVTATVDASTRGDADAIIRAALIAALDLRRVA